MEKSKLNLVLHRIAKNPSELTSRYDVTENFVFELIDRLSSVFCDNSVDIVTFLDDGYSSQYNCAQRLAVDYSVQTRIALISQNIDMKGYLSRCEINILGKIPGISFCSHGVSHAALCKYKNGKVMPTPNGGVYHNMPRGHAYLLTREEVLYQLTESKEQLANIGIKADSFVYPYGIYNSDIINIINKNQLYATAYTCLEGLETGNLNSLEKPRTIIENNLPIDVIIKKIIYIYNSRNCRG